MSEVIAELSTSHGGEVAWQTRLIEKAAEARADWIKFQSYQVKHLSPSDEQYRWFKQAELSDADHERLMKACQKFGCKFLTTPFHHDRVPFLASLGLEAIKIGSGEASDRKMLEAVAQYPWRIIVSTGLMTMADLERMNHLLGAHRVTLLHTVSEYPTPLRNVNLGRMRWLQEHCNRPVGYSDHTEGAAAGLAALGMGADMLEVHMSDPAAPRWKPWDKSSAEVAYLVNFRDTLLQMKDHGRMVWSPTEARPFVGRWRHA